MKHKFLYTLIMLSSTFLPLLAQPGPPEDPTPLPGIAWLIAAGVALGGKKLLDQKRKQQG